MLFYEISYFLMSYIFGPFFGHVSVLFNGFRDYSILWRTRKPHRNQLPWVSLLILLLQQNKPSFRSLNVSTSFYSELSTSCHSHSWNISLQHSHPFPTTSFTYKAHFLREGFPKVPNDANFPFRYFYSSAYLPFTALNQITLEKLLHV